MNDSILHLRGRHSAGPIPTARRDWRGAGLGCLAAVTTGLTGVATAFPQITPDNNTGTISVSTIEEKENAQLSGFTNYGRIENLGVLHNFTSLNNWQLGLGDAILVNNGTLNNTGTITANGASLALKGEINNNGTIFNSGTLYAAYEGIIVNGITGTIDNQAGSNLNFWGTVANFGEIINTNGNPTSGGIYCLNSGHLENHAGATVDNHSGSLTQIAGQIDNSGLIDNGGVFALFNGASLNNSATVTNQSTGSFYSSGTLNQVAGTLTNHGMMSQSGTLTNHSSFVNSATGTLTNQGTLTNHATLVNSGAIVTEGGTFMVETTGSVTGSGSYEQTEGGGGTLRVNGTMTQHSIDIQGGTLGGTGTVTATAGPVIIGANASVAPGNSAGTLGLSGDLNLLGTYQAELVTAGLHDVLTVSDTVDLGPDSTLSMRFLYRPALDDTFDLLTAATINGQFGYATLIIPFDEEEGGGGAVYSEPLDPFAPSVSVVGYTIDFTMMANPAGPGEILRAKVSAVPAIPEPATATFLMTVLGCVLLVRPARRHSWTC